MRIDNPPAAPPPADSRPPAPGLIGPDLIAPDLIADAILRAPGWARVGITAPAPVLREEAALELAHAILQAAAAPPGAPQDQLPLAW